MPAPPLEKAQTVAQQLGLLLVREDDHDHLQAATPMSPVDFAARLMTWCLRFPASITSWGRTNWHNAQVGGVPDSKHQTWLAADLIYD